jgi:hypothetical protein
VRQAARERCDLIADKQGIIPVDGYIILILKLFLKASGAIHGAAATKRPFKEDAK